MAIKATQSVAVSTTAVALTSAAQTSDYQPGSSALLKNAGAAIIYLGADNTVTSASGYPWAPSDGALTAILGPGEQIWGICASATSSTVAVFEMGV